MQFWLSERERETGFFLNSTKKEYEMVNDNRDVYGRWINSNNPRITKSQEQRNTCLWKFLNSFLEKKTDND